MAWKEKAVSGRKLKSSLPNPRYLMDFGKVSSFSQAKSLKWRNEWCNFLEAFFLSETSNISGDSVGKQCNPCQ
ncbi:hypothetical protein QQP08_021091 [Theobroma cacao]|nr:hypothetical protein QQP08_021091 [Theobroma cacao]